MSDAITQLSIQFTLGKTRQAAVFLPGLCGSLLEMGSLPKMLEQLGHTICFPKIEGYYAQTGITPYKEWLDQLDRVVALLHQDHDDVALIGLSMGATLAIAYESKYHKCKSIVALAPVLAYDGWNVPWYSFILSMICRLGVRGWSVKESEPFGLRNTEIRRRVAKQIKAQEISEVGSSSLSANHLYQGLKLIAFAKEDLQDFNADLLIISAIDDDVVSPQSAELINATVKSPMKKLIWLGNSYHIITLDNEREIVVNESIEFIQMSFDASKSYVAYSEEARTLVIRDRIASEL